MNRNKVVRRIDYLINQLYTNKRMGPYQFRPGSPPRKDGLARELRLTDGRLWELSEAGLEDFEALVSCVYSLRLCEGRVEYSDVWSSSKHVIESALSDGLMPDSGAEFLDLVAANLASKVTTYRFLVPVGGLTLQGISEIELGSFKIVAPSLAAMSQAGANIQPYVERSFEALSDHPWLMGAYEGTEVFARRQFESRAQLTIGVLAIYAGSNYENGASGFRISLRMTPEAADGNSTFMYWKASSGEVWVCHGGSSRQELELEKDAEERIRSQGLLDRAFQLIDKGSGTALEECLLRAVYWYADAQHDPVPLMQFVKYWSCVEALFSRRGEVVDSVSTGLAILLVAGGLEIFPASEYRGMRKRIEKMYDARSIALHSGSHVHVSEREVADLSQWTAWMVLVVLSLIENGYTSPEEVQEEVKRLSTILDRGAATVGH